MGPTRLPLVLSLLPLLLWPHALRAAEPLVADLSRHLIAITTGFAGTDVLLFGAVERDGDVVVVVRGPARTEVVRRKDRFGIIWANSASAQAVSVPSYYHVAATRPLDEVAPDAVLKRLGIGLDNIAGDVRGEEPGTDTSTYRDALIRLKQRAGLYGEGVADIGFLGRRLFRTEIHFPANVPVGTYVVAVHLIIEGKVVSTQTTPLIVSKIGLGAEVSDFAHRQSMAYGAAAIALAASAGWLAAAAFRRG